MAYAKHKDNGHRKPSCVWPVASSLPELVVHTLNARLKKTTTQIIQISGTNSDSNLIWSSDDVVILALAN